MRQRLLLAGLLVALPLLLTCAAGGSHGPNVLLITVDTLRLERLSAYGGPAGTSPNIDALAAEGVLFESVQAPRGLTWPSMHTMLTGLHPRSHQVRLNGDMMEASIRTLPEMLHQAGYDTGGFLSNMCDAPNRGLLTFYCAWWADSGPPAESTRRQWASHDQPQWDEAITREAVEFIGRSRRQPFFAWLHYIDPHKPFDPVAAFLRPDGDQTFTAEEETLDRHTLAREPLPPEQQARLLAIYDSQVAGVDAHIGRVLSALKEHGVADNTLVIFSADHGEELGDHQAYFFHLASVYQQVLAVPWILRWPEQLAAGVRVPQLVATADITPTIADLLGMDTGTAFDGESRAPLARNQAGARGASLVFSEWTDQILIVGENSWRYVYNPNNIATFGLPYTREPHSGFRIDAGELYDLGTDPRQAVDVAGEHPEVVQRLRREACAFLTSHEFRRQHRVMDVAVRARLQSLGYVQDEELDEGQHLAATCTSLP